MSYTRIHELTVQCPCLSLNNVTCRLEKDHGLPYHYTWSATCETAVALPTCPTVVNSGSPRCPTASRAEKRRNCVRCGPFVPMMAGSCTMASSGFAHQVGASQTGNHRVACLELAGLGWLMPLRRVSQFHVGNGMLSITSRATSRAANPFCHHSPRHFRTTRHHFYHGRPL